MTSLKLISLTLLCQQQQLQIQNTKGIKEHNRTKLPQLKNNITLKKILKTILKTRLCLVRLLERGFEDFKNVLVCGERD